MYIKSLEDNKRLEAFPSFILEDLGPMGLFVNRDAVETVERAVRRMLDKIYDTDADSAPSTARTAKRRA
jgi:hypothetical protein